MHFERDFRIHFVVLQRNEYGNEYGNVTQGLLKQLSEEIFKGWKPQSIQCTVGH